jgi:hypothetical protein
VMVPSAGGLGFDLDHEFLERVTTSTDTIALEAS